MKVGGLHASNLFDQKTLQNNMISRESNLAIQNNLTVSSENIDSIASQSASSSENMLSANFVSSGSSEQSKYLNARKAGQEALSKHVNAQNAILNVAMAQSTDDSYASRNLAGKRAARMIMDDMQRAAFEESERNLKESKDNIEERAEAAMNGTHEVTDQDADTAPSSVSVNVQPQSTASSKGADVSTFVNIVAESPVEQAPSATPEASVDIVV